MREATEGRESPSIGGRHGDPPDPLEGYRAVVTGGSSGIGRSIALAYAAAGADLLVTYNRGEEGARETAAAAAAFGVVATVAQADMADADAVRRLVAEAYEKLGRVDVWVNNAGADILTGAGARASDLEKLDRLLAVDLRGTVLCSWLVAERMKQAGGGVILNMSWDHVATAPPLGMPGRESEMFSAVKGGVAAFSRSLARTVAPEVRVNVLAPGWIATAFSETLPEAVRKQVADATPLARWGLPEDVAQAAVFLASPQAAFLTGVVLPVNGGVV